MAMAGRERGPGRGQERGPGRGQERGQGRGGEGGRGRDRGGRGGDRFAALVVVGDQKGRVGHGAGKAREVPEAIRKATEQAKRNMIRVPLREGRTLHHDTRGRCGAGRVYLRSAPQGTGIIAGGPLRAIFEALGIQDIVAKAIGSNNPHSMVNATFDALQNMQSPRQVANRRSKKVSDIVANREAARSQAEKVISSEDEE